jgi:hypothetical protein
MILNILYGEAQKIYFWTAKQNYQLLSNQELQLSLYFYGTEEYIQYTQYV